MLKFTRQAGRRRLGFTLAEVLITLMIIGVIAAMTIPTFMANTQKKEFTTAHFVFSGMGDPSGTGVSLAGHGKFQEALRHMNAQGKLMGHADTAAFVTELQNFMKIDKVCDRTGTALSECFTSTVYNGSDSPSPSDLTEVSVDDLSNTNQFQNYSFEADLMGVRFANGYSMLLGYNDACNLDQYSNEADVNSCVEYVYDVNTGGKPNKQKDNLSDIAGSMQFSFGNFFPNCLPDNSLCWSDIFASGGAMHYSNIASILPAAGIPDPYPTFTYTYGEANATFGCTGTTGDLSCPDMDQVGKDYCAMEQGHLPDFDELATIVDYQLSQGDLTLTSGQQAFAVSDVTGPISTSILWLTSDDSAEYYYPNGSNPAAIAGGAKWMIYSFMCVKGSG